MTGTLLNTLAVVIGASLGLLLGQRLPDRMRTTVMHGLGLVTLVAGLRMALGTANILIVMGSILLGAVSGEWLRIEQGLQTLGDRLQARFKSSSSASLAEGFVTASLIFCVGPMAILGSIRDGMVGDYSLLAIKSLLDGFASLALAASLGIGVLFSAASVLVMQGSISLLAAVAKVGLSEAMVTEMSAAGGVVMMGISLLLLDLKRIRVASLLPAIAIAPLIVAILAALGISIRP
ncbi:MAG: putative membrane protein YdfK [Chloroflexi bacterium ADurb.Bin180]|nr:MAG: putative membrane protein YdfK [Chloroflexi bacterium ADurb.Bin180]